MARKTADSLMEQRTHAMTMVLLTGRDDLKVVESRVEGIDLFVSILKQGKTTLRQFGLILRGHVRELRSPKEAGSALNSIRDQLPEVEPFSTPICVFLANMTGFRSFYAWEFEPTSGANGPRLLHRNPLECKDLNEAALADIVSCVDNYYDALLSESLIKS